MNDTEPFETLDPADWDEMRALAHRMVDDAIDYLATVAERPVWQSVPQHVRETFDTPAPRGPTKPEDVYQAFRENIFPYPMGNIHPRFWAWYMGSGTVMGALADFLASVMNPNLGGGNHVANMVEAQVIGWMRDIMSFPDDASGLLVSGGSMANFIGIAVARTTHCGFAARREGVAAAPGPLIVYAFVPYTRQ
jgi:glutamate/tyrosine decarboxylase-like PLP-dependent enzyme